jgi:iron complex transport system substrate-binding protein
MVGANKAAEAYAQQLEENLERLRADAAALPRHPRVYFEEWDEPMISGIAWVSELIGVAGGVDVFPERATCPLAKDRIIADARDVVRAQPDVILGSWCGKRFRPERVATREGWAEIPAVRTGELHEIKSPEILQPGPAALTDGVTRMHEIFVRWSGRSMTA